MRLNSRISKDLWAYVVSIAVYLLNRSPSIALDNKTTQEVWKGKEVDYSGIKIFRCLAYVNVPGDERSNLDAKSKQCIFLGIRKV